MLLDISQVISSQMNVNIHKLTIASEEGVFDGTVELRVHDREDVGNIINQLKKITDIQDVTQII
jgi:GTP pyrophosphokinase